MPTMEEWLFDLREQIKEHHIQKLSMLWCLFAHDSLPSIVYCLRRCKIKIPVSSRNSQRSSSHLFGRGTLIFHQTLSTNFWMIIFILHHASFIVRARNNLHADWWIEEAFIGFEVTLVTTDTDLSLWIQRSRTIRRKTGPIEYSITAWVRGTLSSIKKNSRR